MVLDRPLRKASRSTMVPRIEGFLCFSHHPNALREGPMMVFDQQFCIVASKDPSRKAQMSFHGWCALVGQVSQGGQKF